MEVVNDWKEFTFHKLLYCIWKFLAAHPSEGQSSLLSTHVLNTAQHWLNMPVIFADCVMY